MEEWGNARAAEYFEAELPSHVVRPKEGDPVRVTEKFIRDKYEHRRFRADINSSFKLENSQYTELLHMFLHIYLSQSHILSPNIQNCAGIVPGRYRPRQCMNERNQKNLLHVVDNRNKQYDPL